LALFLFLIFLPISFLKAIQFQTAKLFISTFGGRRRKWGRRPGKGRERRRRWRRKQLH
jgi:hypothetical protein